MAKASSISTRQLESWSLTPAKNFALSLRNAGLWFLFFLAIYVILVLKVLTYETVFENVFFGLYSILITTYILSRFVLSYFHKPCAASRRYEPTVTFVVPAKNEEDNIGETIRRFSEVDYPLDKVEIIAINDGSTDKTHEEMLRVRDELAGKIKRFEVIDWQVNRGKRHGMAEGVKRSQHDIVIFVDSDSFIDRHCVRHLVKYFSEPEVGAVSGHTDVYNWQTNLLTRMQAVRYYIAFTVYKSAESVFGNVTCCPGCCSAYRRSYLMDFIEEWLHQKFLGEQCTFGDDRSLTNFIIRKYRAVYSREATAHTVVPENFRQYVRQQQRWKKSWVRETFIASAFMWRRNVFAALSFYAYVFLALISPIVFFRAMIWHPWAEREWPLVYLFGLLLMLVLHGLYYRLLVGEKARHWPMAILMFWFNTVILMWQLPWAMITIKDSRWGTR